MTQHLRRALGLRTIVSTSAGLAFAAVNYLAAAGLVVYMAGDSAWLAVALGGILMLIVWGCYSELNGLYPTAAAIRLFMSKSMNDRVALVITFTYLSTIVLVLAADAYIIGSAIAFVLGGAAWAAPLYIAGVLALATWVNLRGVKIAGGVQDAATYFVIAATIVIVLIGLSQDGFALKTPFSPLEGHSIGEFIQAVALAVFLFSAFEWVTTSSEEVREPKLIPRGMVLALGLLGLACGLMTIGMSHFLSGNELTSAYPQIFMARHIAGRTGMAVMMLVTAITAINTFNGGFITASRFIYAIAREGKLPPMWADLNTRAVPYVPVIALGALSMVLALVVALTGSWMILISTGAALEAMIYCIAGYCVFKLRRRMPDAERPFRMIAGRWLAVAAMVIFGLLALVASITVGNNVTPVPLAIILAMAALATAYVLVALPRLEQAEAARRAARGSRRRPVPAARAAGGGVDEGTRRE